MGKVQCPCKKEENKIIVQVNVIRYLGVQIDRTGSDEIEISARMEATVNIYYALKYTLLSQQEIGGKTKRTVYGTMC